MLSIIIIACICLLYFISFYHFQKKLFKIMTASINEYLGNSLDFYFHNLKEKPVPNTWNKKEFRLSEYWNHEIEDL